MDFVQIIPVTRVSDVVKGGSFIWYSREIDLCPPCRRAHPSRGVGPRGRWAEGGRGGGANPPPAREKSLAGGGWRGETKSIIIVYLHWWWFMVQFTVNMIMINTDNLYTLYNAFGLRLFAHPPEHQPYGSTLYNLQCSSTRAPAIREASKWVCSPTV